MTPREPLVETDPLPIPYSIPDTQGYFGKVIWPKYGFLSKANGIARLVCMHPEIEDIFILGGVGASNTFLRRISH